MKWIDRLLLLTVFIMMLVALYAAFIYAPTEKVMGTVQRIFYFHLASAWTALLCFFMVFLGGAVYLWGKKDVWDRFAHANAELGVLFTTVVLVMGAIWAKPVWNTWWTWDPRLTSAFILWLIYIAYLLLRSSLRGHPGVRTYAAVYGIIGFVDVPIVWMSIHWWRTIHPKIIERGKINLAPEMWYSVLISFAAILLLYVVLLRSRMQMELVHDRIESLQETLEEQ
jgi:heme exporter protein C